VSSEPTYSPPPLAWKVLIALGPILGAIAIFTSVLLWDTQEEEGDERRHQSCTLFESDHLADRDELVATYDFLAAIKPHERDTALVNIVVGTLPEKEREAHTDGAPDFCDGKDQDGNDIGLEEPDPVVPCRPKFVQRFTSEGNRYRCPNDRSDLPKDADARHDGPHPTGSSGEDGVAGTWCPRRLVPRRRGPPPPAGRAWLDYRSFPGQCGKNPRRRLLRDRAAWYTVGVRGRSPQAGADRPGDGCGACRRVATRTG
jgi:hypothetical protein